MKAILLIIAIILGGCSSTTCNTFSGPSFELRIGCDDAQQ